jgi:ABC-type protease/lipase transport system fused ATPase/permease subunit
MRASGAVVVIMTARRAALAGVDQLAILEAGQMVAFGPKAVLFDQIGHNA